MRGFRGLVVFGLFIALPWLLLATFETRKSTADPRPLQEGGSRSDGGHGPIVVELFTSQGCSSCPPADRLLRELGQGSGGVEVVPLAFHVDYWNYIGWNDPFSAKRWSERQRKYARQLPAGRVYTPQLVVAGRAHLVGSDARSVERALAEAAQRIPAAVVTLEARMATGDRAVEVRVAAELVHADGVRRELWVALRQSGLVTPVERGENARRTLENDFVVRRFEQALTLPGNAGARQERRMSLEVEPEWDLEQLQVVAFLQAVDGLGIDGAAVAAVGEAPSGG